MKIYIFQFSKIINVDHELNQWSARDFCIKIMGDNFYRWLYTAVTRCGKRLFFVNLGEDFVGECANK